MNFLFYIGINGLFAYFIGYGMAKCDEEFFNFYSYFFIAMFFIGVGMALA